MKTKIRQKASTTDEVVKKLSNKLMHQVSKAVSYEHHYNNNFYQTQTQH